MATHCGPRSRWGPRRGRGRGMVWPRIFTRAGGWRGRGRRAILAQPARPAMPSYAPPAASIAATRRRRSVVGTAIRRRSGTRGEQIQRTARIRSQRRAPPSQRAVPPPRGDGLSPGCGPATIRRAAVLAAHSGAARERRWRRPRVRVSPPVARVWTTGGTQFTSLNSTPIFSGNSTVQGSNSKFDVKRSKINLFHATRSSLEL